ncbi:CheR family methyltransferase [Paraflavisolibacter sp. H34]|uniref:CheR family methyltransferase n=1 Tax=Huijunlia imazamoxiresistens TaxID=3127457 RepID=UPI003019268E
MKNASDNKVQSQGGPFRRVPVVAIGAAADGMEALTDFLRHLPLRTGFAYLFLQASEAGGDGRLSETVTKLTEMPVVEPEAPARLEPDRLYVLPADKAVRITAGTLHLEPVSEPDAAQLPVDRMFAAVAESFRESAVAVVLSGPGADGALGLKAVKLAGGLTFVNGSLEGLKATGRVGGEGLADLALPPGDIAEELGKIGRHKELYNWVFEQGAENAISNTDEDLAGLLQLLKKSTGVDFSQYKMSTIKRRIIRRMMLFKQDTLKDYTQFIRRNTNEVSLLYQDLLINVTTFFRDREATEYLRSTVLPRIIQSKGVNDPIRIWVPACSTGQEAYSLAMLVMEVLGENINNIPVQIFATDLSENAINKARLGMYSKMDVLEVSAKRLQRFFTKMDGSYRIVKSIRDLCVFATHNIAKDPPFSRLDIISCCNLMIYLENQLQKRIVATFHYALKSNGYLILGKSETVGTATYLFAQPDKKYKVYSKKKDATAKALFEMNVRTAEAERSGMLARRDLVQRPKTDEPDIDRVVDAMLLKKYTPASVIVNQDLDIVQFRGSTGLYLEPSPGKASLNLMKMARPGLGFELRNIVHKAQKSGEPARKSRLDIQLGAKHTQIAIEAIPLRGESPEEYFLVVFEELPPPAEEKELGSSRDRRAKQLEAELTALREDMRSILEAQEAANEELQSANEEIVSSNEELQSINEELETSKEEIESSNEELITINQELQVRNEQLAEALEYSEAVFTTIRESLLILDKDLQVKTANQAFYRTFLMREEETEGRLLYELGNGQWNIPKLKELLERIIPQNSIFHGYEITHNFTGLGEKVMLLNARRIIQKTRGEELTLLAIEDITEHRRAQSLLFEREAWFHNMTDNAPVMIWVVDTNKFSSFFNKAWLEFRGLRLEEAIGKSWIEGVHPADLDRCVATFDTCFAARQPFELKYRVQRYDDVYRWVLNRSKPNIAPDGRFIGYIGTCVEIHEQDGEKGIG